MTTTIRIIILILRMKTTIPNTTKRIMTTIPTTTKRMMTTIPTTTKRMVIIMTMAVVSLTKF